LTTVKPTPDRTTTTPPAEHTPSTHSISAKNEVSVNLAVLAARIESINLTLETIEAQLNRDAQRLFPDEFKALVAELEEALNRQEMSETYLNLLSDDQRRMVAEVVSPKPILALFVRRLFEAQIVAHERLSTSGLPEDKKTLGILQELTQKVKQWQNR
jgi:hypothetical protein